MSVKLQYLVGSVSMALVAFTMAKAKINANAVVYDNRMTSGVITALTAALLLALHPGVQ